ncbi:MAG TPA: tetratricopeptide repeat protein [Saprospiraceae bacterium]|nr:tetratricopeptide repeat protein [Saprospiraceae bacterium]
MKFTKYSTVFFLFVGLLSTVSCVSHKKKGQVSGIKKFYHNTTAKYNGYFNANEILKLSILTLEDSYKDNYTKTLAVFPYNATDQAEGQKANLDKAIEKVSLDISLHRVSRWADDCYLLLAKAQYLKKDYESAENSFRYLVDEFNPYKDSSKRQRFKKKTSQERAKETKDRKKEIKEKAEEKAKAREKAKKEALKKKKQAAKDKKKGKTSAASKEEPAKTSSLPEAKIPEPKEKTKSSANSAITNEGNFLIKHTPAYWEAVIWSGKNLIERGKHYEAESMFREMQNDELLPEKLRSELYASSADLYLKTKRYDKAISALKLAIQYTKKKKLKARYAYILAQIYQDQKQYDDSDEFFEKSISFKPEYSMSFHAKLNLLVNKSSRVDDKKAIKADLQKLLADSKNEEFQGEIYYSLAEISLSEGNQEEGINHLNSCLRSANVNNDQKADAYATLAEINFKNQDYLKAKYYYDSTLSVLSKNDERRKEFSLMAANLDEIAQQLEIINLQDSLIRMSALSVKEKRALAIQIKNSKSAKILEQTNNNKFIRPGMRGNQFEDIPGFNSERLTADVGPSSKNDNSKGSSFFAYDIRATNRGRSEFEQQWGNRILEDDWRRSNKTSFNNSNVAIGNTAKVENDSLEADLAQILSSIPDTPEELATAHKKIEEALYSLGVLYREKLQNSKKSKETLLSLLSKYPSTQRKPDALYFLYLNCLELNDQACANSYSDQILYEFPDTRYGKFLKDPQSVLAEVNKKDESMQAYENAFDLYSNGEYKKALETLQILKNKLKPQHLLTSKIALLSAFCIGNTEGKDAYVNSLRDVVANFASTPEETKAKEILRFLKGDTDAFEVIRSDENKPTVFSPKEDDVHFITIHLYKPTPKEENALKISISDYHVKYHKGDNLKLSTIQLNIDDPDPVYLVRKFENKAAAMRYYNFVMKRSKEYMGNFTNYEVYVVNQTNYREILKQKSFKEYKAFFDQNYKLEGSN